MKISYQISLRIDIPEPAFKAITQAYNDEEFVWKTRKGKSTRIPIRGIRKRGKELKVFVQLKRSGVCGISLINSSGICGSMG